jgi:hypothetical protein
LPHISVSKALGFAFSFSFRNAAAIAVRIALPALVGWIVLYTSLFLYLTELERYVSDPSDRIASLVLGLATAGLLLTVFLHSVIMATVAALALGLEDGRWKFFHITRREWRLYAANLRLLLVTVIWVVAMQILQFGVAKLSWPAHFGVALNLLMAGGLGLLAVRIWFLVAPVSVAKIKGQILRRSWRLSARVYWRLAAIAAVLLLMGLAMEAAGEIIMRASGMIAPFPKASSLAEFAANYRKILPFVTITIGIAYLIGSVLLVAARVYVYRQLTEQTES